MREIENELDSAEECITGWYLGQKRLKPKGEQVSSE